MPAIATSSKPGHRLLESVFLPALLVTALGCARDSVDELIRSAPALDREIARHLVHDDDSTLVRFLRRAGWPRVYFAQQILIKRDIGSREAFASSEARLLPHLTRLNKAIGPAFNMQQYADGIVVTLQVPLEVRFESGLRIDRIRRVVRDARLPVEQRTRLVQDLAAGCVSCRRAELDALANLAIESGDLEANLRHRRTAFEDARAAGNRNQECWLSGMLGETLLLLGARDSAVRMLESGLIIAKDHQLIDHVARLNLFLGNLYANEGRWGLASHHLDEVRRLAREPAMEGQDVRFLCESLQFPMRLGWWDRVARDLRAAGPTVRRARRAGSPWVRGWEAGLIEAEALVAAHGGDMGKADRLFAHADAIYREGGGRIPKRGLLLARWSRALVEAGRLRDAAAVARTGLTYCDSLRVPEHASSNAVVLARALLMSGDVNGCGRALAAFDSASSKMKRPPLRECVEYEAVRARWHMARGDGAGMLKALRSGLEGVESGVTAMDATPETYTFLYGRNDLRDLLYELVHDAEFSLEIERRWRRAATLVRGDAPTGVLIGCSDLVAAHRNGAALPASVAAVPGGNVELVYHVGRRVIRWTRDRSGTRRDELPTSPWALEQKVGRAMEMMAVDPGSLDATVDASLASALRELSNLLLPDGLQGTRTSGPRRLHIQADGVLASFPFEALNSARGYRPLQEDWNVAYVRGESVTSTKAPRGTILADPDVSPDLSRMYGGFSALPHGRAEAATMASLDPAARRLTGSSATKHALKQVWTDSRYLFLATHASGDPQGAPAFFVPLAPDTLEDRIDDEYLEVADVLAADLSRCELVVLSGCATGVPVGLASSGAPSLASAFIDAGAAAVIRTAWPVRDDEAAATMVSFIDLWKRRGMAPDEALNEARRRRMKGPRGYRHPSVWAAYGIELRRERDDGDAPASRSSTPGAATE